MDNKIKNILSLEKILKEIYKEECKDTNIDLSTYFAPHSKINNLSELMYKMMFHVQNSGHKRNIIKLEKQEQESILSDILYNFDSKKIIEIYTNGNDIYQQLINNKNFVNQRIKNSEKTWADYSKSIYEIAYFLNKFDSIDEFRNLINEIEIHIPYILPDIIKHIHGFGPALSSDFIKEFGCVNFIKPDVHLKDFLKQVFNISEQETTFYDRIQNICKQLNWTPYKFDKIIYLYCTHNFYLSNKESKNKKKNNQRRKKLIEYINKAI